MSVILKPAWHRFRDFLVISIQRICIGLHNQQPTEVLDIGQLEQSFYKWKQQPVTNQWPFQPFVNKFMNSPLVSTICKQINIIYNDLVPSPNMHFN